MDFDDSDSFDDDNPVAELISNLENGHRESAQARQKQTRDGCDNPVDWIDGQDEPELPTEVGRQIEIASMRDWPVRDVPDHQQS